MAKLSNQRIPFVYCGAAATLCFFLVRRFVSTAFLFPPLFLSTANQPAIAFILI
jgi:hypothetical protein